MAHVNKKNVDNISNIVSHINLEKKKKIRRKRRKGRIVMGFNDRINILESMEEHVGLLFRPMSCR